MTKLCPDQIYTIPQQPAALTAPAPANDGALILDIVNTSDNCNDYNGTSNIDKYYADANYHVFVSSMQTGNIVVNENMKGLPQNISTTGWPSGIYVVKTNISGIQLEGKAIIK